MSNVHSSRRQSPLSIAGALTLLMGLLLVLLPLAPTPASAAPTTDCSTLVFQAGRVIDRVILQTAGITVDTDDADTTCEKVGNALRVAVDGDPVIITSAVADAPNLHTSCSVDYDGLTFTLAGTSYTVTDHEFAVNNFPGQSAATCETVDDTPASFAPVTSYDNLCTTLGLEWTVTLDNSGSVDGNNNLATVEFTVNGTVYSVAAGSTDFVSGTVALDGAAVDILVTYNGASDPYTADPANCVKTSAPVIDISPIVECATLDGEGDYTIYWGYENSSTLDGEPYTVLASEVSQSFTGGTATLPTSFGYPGVVDDRPGRTAFDQAEPNAFITSLASGETQVWTLDGSTATASQATKSCPQPPPDPEVQVIKVFTDQNGEFLNDEFDRPDFLVELFDGTDTSGDADAFDSNDAGYGDNVAAITGDFYSVTETVSGWSAVACDETVLGEFGALADGLGTFTTPKSQDVLYSSESSSNVSLSGPFVHLVCNAEDTTPTPTPTPIPTPTPEDVTVDVSLTVSTECDVNGSFSFEAVDGVNWLIDGVPVTPGTYVYDTGDTLRAVDADADDLFVLTGTTDFDLTGLVAEECPEVLGEEISNPEPEPTEDTVVLGEETVNPVPDVEDEQLAATGLDSALGLALGSMLVAGGLMLLLVDRRRQFGS